jgi:hypothetical protein
VPSDSFEIPRDIGVSRRRPLGGRWDSLPFLAPFRVVHGMPSMYQSPKGLDPAEFRKSEREAVAQIPKDEIERY